MAHSNLYSYPLPFPTEDQLMQVSSYSSLANALGTDSGYASRQGRRPQPMNCDAVVDKQAKIYLDGPPVSNPLYPYPARNVFNPGTYPARTPLTVSKGRYDLLPQPLFVEPDDAPDFPAIHFLRKDDKKPYSIWNLLTMDTMPDLVAGDMPIFIQGPDPPNSGPAIRAIHLRNGFQSNEVTL
ncbi:hypothetical protein L210DRAFT_3539478 [Boletus edulis BED1]|uniref:Uncharacterized protein n=1 Tax=Boletus edulis BED1 TaxID=1328754 RepID=A0AAD4BVN7_BOLED|nr:hypothetical protein L210DRAFT_3539478 [Boletus edulis BED1]